MNSPGKIPLQMYWWPGMDFNWRLLRVIKHGGLKFSWRFPHVRNFGDHLAPLIVSLLAGRPVAFSGQGGDGRLLSLGSILHFVRDGDVVWGSGLAKAQDADRVKRAKGVKILAVRGPRTRAALTALGIDCPEVYGDPALLLPRLVVNDVNKRYVVGIVPHFSHYPEVWKQMRASKDRAIKLINVTEPWPVVVRNILSCEVILASSLHGIILAEAYGIPAVYLDRGWGGGLKINDYYASTDREPVTVKYDGPANLRSYVDAAVGAARPRIDLAPLLAAFRRHWGAFDSVQTSTWLTCKVKTNHRGEVLA